MKETMNTDIDNDYWSASSQVIYKIFLSLGMVKASSKYKQLT